MRVYLKGLVFSFFFLFSFQSFSQQVTGVDGLLSYNDETCVWDCGIIITNGSATNGFFRTLFTSSYVVVVPTNSTVTLSENYNPIINNQSGTGTTPVIWNSSNSTLNVDLDGDMIGDGVDFYPFYNTTVPSAQFFNLATNDTIVLFSINIEGLTNCGEEVRLFQNGVDPGTVNGGAYGNAITIGGTANDYTNNRLIGYPEAEVPSYIVDNQGVVSIDLQPDASCSSVFEYAWTGPNGFTSTNEDVLINSAGSSDYGVYEVVVTNLLGCKDTLAIDVEEPGGTSLPDDLTISSLILNPTFENIAIHLDIEGDGNSNSTVEIEYRVSGSSMYLPGAMTMRGHPEMTVDGGPLDLNFHAGSAMHLMPNTSYDIQITVTDPDGGSQVITQTVVTKEFPNEGSNPAIKYVVPGNGGGDGTISNPYQGLQAAADNAMPGDVFQVADGIYSPFSLTASGTDEAPITFKSTSLHGAVIDGTNTNTGVVTIGTATDSIAHITIDGFDIKNGKWGIDAQNTQYFTAKNNKITDVDYGIVNRRELGYEHDQYFHNNEIIGRTIWPQLDGNIPSERGIDMRGNRNVASSNSIANFGDGISTDGPASQISYALDIHNNSITNIVDDLIEVDGSISNTRIYRNEVFNGRMGVSVAPVFGGPAYIFQNEMYNLETSAIKMNNQAAGLIIVNNSIASLGEGLSSPAGWQNTIFKNNLILTNGYVYEEYGLVSGSIDDWNNNAYFSTRAGTASEPWFKWNDVTYSTLADLNASGLIEGSSIEAAFADFVNVMLPVSYGVEADPEVIDFNLVAGSDLIDQGIPMINILEGIVPNSTPDIGALEYNQQQPEYGASFASVCERLDLSSRIWNGMKNGGWHHPDNWTPCGIPTKITDVTIPSSLNQYPVITTPLIMSKLYILDGGVLELPTDIEVKLTGE